MNTPNNFTPNICAVMPVYWFYTNWQKDKYEFYHGVTLCRATGETLHEVSKNTDKFFLGVKDLPEWSFSLDDIEWLMVLDSQFTHTVKSKIIDEEMGTSKDDPIIRYRTDESPPKSFLFCLSLFSNERILAPFVAFADVEFRYDTVFMRDFYESSGDWESREILDTNATQIQASGVKEPELGWEDLNALQLIWSKHFELISSTLKLLQNEETTNRTSSILERAIVEFAKADLRRDDTSAFTQFVAVLELLANGQSKTGLIKRKVSERIPEIIGYQDDLQPQVEASCLTKLYNVRSEFIHASKRFSEKDISYWKLNARNYAANALKHVLLNKELFRKYNGRIQDLQDFLDKRWPVNLK